jgi:O-antigen biosynthesis protein
MAPLVSCIIPLFNQLELTRRMLQSLRESLPPGMPVEILLVDDGSTDGTRQWAMGPEATGCRLLLNDTNRGYAHSNNKGAAAAKGRYLALLNNDLLLDRGWLEPLLATAEELGEHCGVIGNLQFRVEDKSLDHAGVDVTREGKLRHLDHLPQLNQNLDRGLPVLAVTAACCLVPREAFIAVQGFDEAFVNGGEDIDLCLRLRALGHPPVICPRSQVLHHVSATRGKTSLSNERNSRLLYQRHHETLLARIASAWMDPSYGPVCNANKAWTLARSALWREEARWISLFREAPEPPPPSALSWSGFRRSKPGSTPWIDGEARIILPPGRPTRNLFIAGTLLPTPEDSPESAGPLGLRVIINRAQIVQFDEIPEGNFNLPIDHPAALPDKPTEVVLELLNEPPRIPEFLKHLCDLIPGSLGKRLGAWARRRKQRRLYTARIIADDQTALETELAVAR